jgi:hypothetical protein
MADNVIYSRSTESVQPDYKTLAAKGVTVALNANDPHLAEQVARARENGMNPAIWIPAGTGADPAAYAQKMAAIVQQYKPSSIIPNIEQDGKGYEGSKGWNWSAQMMAEYQKYVPAGSGPPLSVSVMGEKDFNYKPYIDYGGNVQAETFGAKTSDHKDVDAMRQTLLDAGVPENRITMLLAPGQSAQNWKGSTAGYTLDDMSPQQLSQMQNNASSAVSGTQSGTQVDGPSVYTNAGFAQSTDAKDPRAVAYAKQRLAQLQKQGYSPKDFGITGDPTAQWRAMSSIMGAEAAINSGHPEAYHVGADVPSSVADVVNGLLKGATSRNAGPGSDAPASLVNAPAPAYTPPTDLQGIPAGTDTSGIDSVMKTILAAQHVRQLATPGQAPQAPRPVTPQGPVAPAAPRTVAQLQPHQMIPLTPEAKRVGPMQQAIQVAAALKTLRQLRPSTPVKVD